MGDTGQQLLYCYLQSLECRWRAVCVSSLLPEVIKGIQFVDGEKKNVVHSEWLPCHKSRVQFDNILVMQYMRAVHLLAGMPAASPHASEFEILGNIFVH